MTRRLLSTTVFCQVVAIAYPVNASAPNLIDVTYGVGAGSFELGPYVGIEGGYMRLPSGSTVITGWSVGGESGVDWSAAPNHAPLHGSKSLDLKGTTAGAFGQIFTVVPTHPGFTYTVRFGAYGGNLNNTGVVSAGTLQGQVFNGQGFADPSQAHYASFAFEFIANDSSTTVTFQSLASDGFGPVIDDVRVETVCSVLSVADLDGDCDVDADDFVLFKACASGSAVPLTPDCENRDFDHDDDVDMDDFGIFQRCYSGSGNAPEPNCAN